MKSIKDIREQFDILTEMEQNQERKLTTLIRAGLMDTSKLQLVKRALDKDNRVLTPSERNALLALLDSLMDHVLNNKGTFQKVKSDLHEAAKPLQPKNDYLSKFDPRFGYKYPPESIPSIIMLKRKAIRVFPDGQKIGLYYAQALDKYVSIPFEGINVSEEVEQLDEVSAGLASQVYAKRANQALDTSNEYEKETDPRRRAKLHQRYRQQTRKADATYARLGNQKLSTKDKYFIVHKNAAGQVVPAGTKGAVPHRVTASSNTEYGPEAQAKAMAAATDLAKEKKKDKSTGSRWYELGKKHGKIFRDVKRSIAANVDKANYEKFQQSSKPQISSTSVRSASRPSRRAGGMPIKEDFRLRLQLMREEKAVNESALGALDTGAEIMVPYYSAAKKVMKGDWKGAATDAAVDTALLGVGAVTGGAGYVAGKAAKAGIKLGTKALSSGAKATVKTGARSLTAAEKSAARAAKLEKLGSSGKAAKMGKEAKAARAAAGKAGKGGKLGKLARIAGLNALGGNGGSSSSSSSAQDYVKKTDNNYQFGKVNPKVDDSFAHKTTGSAAVAKQRDILDRKAQSAMAKAVQENYIKPTDKDYKFTLKVKTKKPQSVHADSAIRKQRDILDRKAQAAMAKSMQEESNFKVISQLAETTGDDALLRFADKSITINSTVAKKIMNLHESVNKSNKKKIESMLEESASSFNKILTFAVRH